MMSERFYMIAFVAMIAQAGLLSGLSADIGVATLGTMADASIALAVVSCIAWFVTAGTRADKEAKAEEAERKSSSYRPPPPPRRR